MLTKISDKNNTIPNFQLVVKGLNICYDLQFNTQTFKKYYFIVNKNTTFVKHLLLILQRDNSNKHKGKCYSYEKLKRFKKKKKSTKPIYALETCIHDAMSS